MFVKFQKCSCIYKKKTRRISHLKPYLLQIKTGRSSNLYWLRNHHQYLRVTETSTLYFFFKFHVYTQERLICNPQVSLHTSTQGIKIKSERIFQKGSSSIIKISKGIRRTARISLGCWYGAPPILNPTPLGVYARATSFLEIFPFPEKSLKVHHVCVYYTSALVTLSFPPLLSSGPYLMTPPPIPFIFCSLVTA